MKSEQKGWVVINIGHPTSGNKFIVDSTFSYKRTDAIKKMLEGTTKNWNYWKRRFNYRVVKATQSVLIAPE